MKKIAKDVYDRLSMLIESPKSELNYTTEFELLVAVMLSAQCTDKRVNMITDKLFKVYNTPEQFSKISVEDLEQYINSCNYYHNKAKNIINASKVIVDKFNGVVPSSHQDLVSLPGVGNKTANVVQAVAFGMSAMPVDTHILRVSNRLGFANTKNPNICEKELIKMFNNYNLGEIHHLLLLFGRYHCMARNPKCDKCVLKDYCKDIKN